MTPYYDDGQIQIWHADCREVVVPEAHVMVTDPPYGIAYESGQMGTMWWQGEQISNDADTSVRDSALQAWGDRPALVFGSWKAQKPAGTRTVLVWDKGPALGMGALDLPWKPNWDEIYVLGRGFHGYRGSSVLSYSPVQSMAKNGRQHPNEKPVALLRYLIGTCPPGTIFDPFMGSGTTLRAAKDLGRTAIGIEIDERYCEIAAKRLRQAVLPLEVST